MLLLDSASSFLICRNTRVKLHRRICLTKHYSINPLQARISSLSFSVSEVRRGGYCNCGLRNVIGVIAVTAVALSALQDETLSNIPFELSGDCTSSSLKSKDCEKPRRIQRPKSRKAESCTTKCVTTCIRGGEGSPGEGPLNIRRPLVVFKQGFRSRRYCLVECSDICNLLGDGDDGP